MAGIRRLSLDVGSRPKSALVGSKAFRGANAQHHPTPTDLRFLSSSPDSELMGEAVIRIAGFSSALALSLVRNYHDIFQN
jgi:hypothetical protein